jgi:hypothetical protein
MPPIRTGRTRKLIEQEGRIELAIQALRNKKIASITEAARVYKVPRTILRDRVKGIGYRNTTHANCSKLDKIEEDSLKRWILDLDMRGKTPTLAMAKKIANILLAQRSVNTPPLPISKNWISQFITRRKKLKTRFSHRYTA